MSRSLQQRIIDELLTALQYREDAWVFWCDPWGYWESLLQRVFISGKMKNVTFLPIGEKMANEVGNLHSRRIVLEHIEARKPFVLYVKAPTDALGWLWVYALLADKVYARSLRDQLLDWGWKPQNRLTSPDVVAQLAWQNLDLDPVEWGGGKIQTQPLQLLDILAGGSLDHGYGAKADRTVLHLTIEEAGLPKLEEEALVDKEVLERWRIRCVAHLLITQVHHLSPACIQNHEYLITAEKRSAALKLVDLWLDSLKLRRGLPDRVLEADRMLNLGSFMGSATLDQGPFLSHAAESAVFAALCTKLAAKRGRDLLDALVPLYPVLERHAQGFWGDGQEKPLAKAIAWGELARLSEAVKMLLDAAPTKPWSRPSDAVEWYVKQGWRVEQAGDNILRHLSRPTTELLNLITPLRDTYYNHWEQYMIDWSDIWNSAGCPLPELSGRPLMSQGRWLKDQLKASGKGPTAVIIIDALRYDVGVAMQELVNKQEGIERAQVSPARTSLPTITALGMGMALPIDEEELQAEIVSGKWVLHQRGQPLNLSIAENRREWLKTYYKLSPDAIIPLSDALAGRIPEPQGKRPYLFLYDALIDKLGHDEELKPLGTEEIQEQYVTTIEQLRDTGWKRVLIVTDHGFIHWSGNIERKVQPLPGALYSSRRAMVYQADTKLEGPQRPVPGGTLKVAVPNGASCFRTYGGLSFFHGGASLQEWIVPCIAIEWPFKAEPVQLRLQPTPQILSLRQKIVIEVLNNTLFGNPATLSRQIEVLIRDTKTQTILFHATKMITPSDQGNVSVNIVPQEGVEAERGTPLTIELRDTRTQKLIGSPQLSTLRVALENW